MFPLSITVTITGNVTQRKLNRWIKLAMTWGLYQGLKRYCPLHFKRTAYYRYPEAYEVRRKHRGGKHSAKGPNVQTGRMVRQLTQSFNVKGTIRHLRGEMRGPEYTDVSADRRQPDKAAEITCVSESEKRQLLSGMEEFLADLIDSDTEQMVIRIAA